MMNGTRISLFALAVAIAAPALAQAGDTPAPAPAQASRTTVYQADFFASYAPRNALDIARRVPGFNLDLGNTDIRGFGAAAGNVVINGARPSSKAESLETTLARIPASRVARVEVGPGDLYGADYSSRSQVLNIIMSAEGGIDGNVTGELRRLYTGRLVPDGSVSALGVGHGHAIHAGGGIPLPRLNASVWPGAIVRYCQPSPLRCLAISRICPTW